MKETDLYPPIKQLLNNMGYDVMSEVTHIDVLAIKNDTITIIELKTAFTLKLILQAIERQKLTEYVYIAIPKPSYRKSFGRDFASKRLLLRRLGLGLIFIHTKSTDYTAEIIFDPKPFNMKQSISKNKRKRDALLTEYNKRHGDYNVAGTNGKLITSYREKALLIASLLEENGAMSTKQLRNRGMDNHTTRILYQNHYGWFEHVSRGVYGLSENGIKEIQTYKNVLSQLKETYIKGE